MIRSFLKSIRTKVAAFSLVELAVVLVIVSVVVGAAISLTMSTQEQSDALQTKQRVTTINKAIEQFRDTNGRLPCPANIAKVPTDADFGEEDCTLSGTVINGTVPVRALNLPDEYAADGWDNKVVYAVTKALSESSSSFTRNHGAITVKKGGETTSDGKLAYVVLSHGRDGKGGVPLNATAPAVACGSGTADAENCGGNASLFNVADFNAGEIDADYFDDVIIAAHKNPSLGTASTPTPPPPPPPPPGPSPCASPCGTIAHGATCIAYQAASVACGSSCVSETRTCSNGSLSGTYSNASCSVTACASCTLPWGGTLAHGLSTSAYSTGSVTCPSTCPAATTRSCNDGVLSGSGNFASCSAGACASCTLPWGGTLSHGNSTTAYSTSSVACGSSCPAGTTRTCTNGTLSGSGDHASCSVAACASCTLPWGGSIAHGASASAYSVSSVTCPATCPAATTRTCTNGTLSGSGNFASCSAGACASCASPCGTIAHGATCTAWNVASSCGGCASETRTCTNGTLSGSYGNASCNNSSCASCSLPWGGSIGHGASTTSYSTGSVACGSSCPAGTTRTCTNGSLSGSGDYGSCSVAACASCSLPWGGSIAHGASATAWNTSASCGSCASETRSCNNGSLSGSYGNASCNNSSCASCSLPWGGSIAHGASTTSYSTGSVACGSSCPAGTTRTCSNGTLSGSGNFGSCSVAACASCASPCGTIAHGGTCTAWNVSASCGGCASETRSCNNGSLSGSYGNASCNNSSCASCSSPCGTIGHGASCTAYAAASVCTPASCSSETRTCSNGSLSGSYANASCSAIFCGGDGGGDGGCFAGDTAVLMADGTTRAIKDIKRGDKVMAYDKTKAGSPLVARKVNATIRFENQKAIRINHSLVVTPDHKFPVADGSSVVMMQAGDLDIGSTLFAADGTPITVTSIERGYGTIDTYNMEVDGLNSYVAGGVRTGNMIILPESREQYLRSLTPEARMMFGGGKVVKK